MNENEFKPTTDLGRGITSLWRTLFYNAIRLLKRWSTRQEPSLPNEYRLWCQVIYFIRLHNAWFVFSCDFWMSSNLPFLFFRSVHPVLEKWEKTECFGNFCVDFLAPVQGILFCPWPTDADTVLQSKLAIEERKGWEREASKSVVDHHSSLSRNLY